VTEARGSLLGLIGFALATTLLLSILNTRFHLPFPPMPVSLATQEAGLHEAGGVVLGLRRLAADMAWIQTLQYYGTHAGAEHGAGHHHFEDEGSGKEYPRFLAMCRQVTSLDPHFTYAYYYGGGVLGWNLNRLDEAESFLREGIAFNPHEWRLPLYLAGLAYQKNHDVANLTRFLETIAADPDCPLMMKAILANVYKKRHEYDKALGIWEVLYASGDPVYQQRAMDEFHSIQKLRKQPKT
jgi:tetratricopeptide (TPR) repeat protein